jgi:heptosyltransferase-2
VKILLVRPDGIGDEILCLPVATALRKRMPEVQISFLSSVYAASVLSGHPDIDQVITVTGQETFRDLVRLFRRGFDAAIFLKPFRRFIYAAWAARIPLRIGTGYRWYSFLLNRRVFEHRKDFTKHESVYNVRLLSGLGLSLQEEVSPRLFITQEEKECARALLGEKKTSRILVHPGGFSSRSWKPEYFRELIVQLAHQGHEVLLTGSSGERDRFMDGANSVKWPRRIRNLMGELTIRQLMGVIRESDLVISLATGPMHIAAAFDVPTLSIFDPRRSNSPTRWKPLGRGIILRPGVPVCERCTQKQCDYWDCMDRVTPGIVMEYVNRAGKSTQPVEIVTV